MIILVTGAAGFIGSRLCHQLISEGYKVIGIDNFNDYYNPKIKRNNIIKLLPKDNFRLIEADIRDAQTLNRIFSDHSINCVVHLAARAGVRPSLEKPQLYWDVNIIGSLILLETMQYHQVPQLVFASSSSVYGNRDKGPFKETDNTDYQVSPYGATKKSLEILTATYAHLYKIQTTGLRFFTVYGPHNRPDMACYLFTDAISRDRPITMFGDGRTGRDYTYIDDIVDGIIKSVEKPQAYEIINLGNSSPILLKDMIEVIETEVGKKAIIEQKPMQSGDVLYTYADTTKAKKILGWSPQTDFETGIAHLVSWYKQHHDQTSN